MNGPSTFPNMVFGWVGVVDVAEEHILAFEVPSANGRYPIIDRVVHYSEIVAILRKLYPGCSLPTKCADDKPFVLTFKVSKEKAEKLSVNFTPVEEAIRQTVESVKEKMQIWGTFSTCSYIDVKKSCKILDNKFILSGSKGKTKIKTTVHILIQTTASRSA